MPNPGSNSSSASTDRDRRLPPLLSILAIERPLPPQGVRYPLPPSLSFFPLLDQLCSEWPLKDRVCLSNSLLRPPLSSFPLPPFVLSFVPRPRETSAVSPQRRWGAYSRALVVLAAEELCQLSEVVALAALLVAALSIAASHTRLVVLRGAKKSPKGNQ